MEQLSRVKDLAVPEFGTLLAWEARASAATRAANGDMGNDPSKSSQGYGGTPMPFVGETKVSRFFTSCLLYHRILKVTILTVDEFFNEPFRLKLPFLGLRAMERMLNQNLRTRV